MNEFKLTVIGYEETREIDKTYDLGSDVVKDTKPRSRSERYFLNVRLPTYDTMKVEVKSDNFEKYITPQLEIA